MSAPVNFNAVRRLITVAESSVDLAHTMARLGGDAGRAAKHQSQAAASLREAADLLDPPFTDGGR